MKVFIGFRPVWSYVVKWIDVNPHMGGVEYLTNSFQTLLITDGKISLVLFDYLHLTWPNINYFKTIQVGFNLNANMRVLAQNFDTKQFSPSQSKAQSQRILDQLNNGYFV